MSDYLKRAGIGLLFTGCAAMLIHIHSVWALLPAAAGVYMLASVLIDAVRGNY